MGVIEQLRLFLEPRSIALIGASRRTGDGDNVLENLISYGYPGKLYPVNPNAQEILGVRVYHSVPDLPVVTDMALISTPRDTLPQVVGDCVARGIKAITIVAQGLADADEEGRRIQEQVVDIARRGGARVVGPNSFGVANAFINLNTAFVPFKMEKIPVGSIAQSDFLFGGAPRMRMIGKGFDLGNACDVHFADALEYYGADPEVKIIVMYTETIPDGRGFIEVARRISKSKPIIAVKGGTTPLGARLTQSHTGSLAGQNEVYRAAFKQAGIIQAMDLDEMEDLVYSFMYLPPLRGRRVGIMTNAMGAGVLAADACSRHGLELAPLSSGTLKKVSEVQFPWLEPGNPVDIGPAGFSSHGMWGGYRHCLGALLDDENVDVVMVISPGTPNRDPSFPEYVAKAVKAHPDKGVTFWVFSVDVGEEMANRFIGIGKVPAYRTLDRAMMAISRVVSYWDLRDGADGA